MGGVGWLLFCLCFGGGGGAAASQLGLRYLRGVCKLCAVPAPGASPSPGCFPWLSSQPHLQPINPYNPSPLRTQPTRLEFSPGDVTAGTSRWQTLRAMLRLPLKRGTVCGGVSFCLCVDWGGGEG